MTRCSRGSLWAAAVIVALVGKANAAEEEKLLFGFERAEIEKASVVDGRPRDKAFEVKDDNEVLFFTIRTSGAAHDLEMWYIRPMHCVRGEVSQGSYACRITAPLDGCLIDRPRFMLPRSAALPLHYATPQANLRNSEIFNTSGWYDWVFPRDWSGYDLLRIDVRLETPGALKLMLEVEDSWVEPPVSLTFDPPETGTWVTLEMDLAKAAEERGLKITSMENIWVRLEIKDIEKRALEWEELRKAKDKEEMAKRTFVAYVDNVRLCTKGTPNAHPVLAGTRSTYTQTLPRSYAAEELILKSGVVPRHGFPSRVIPADTKMPEEPPVKPDDGPVELSAPSVIPIRDMLKQGSLDPNEPGDSNSVRLTCAAARDADHMLVGFFLQSMGSLKANATAERPAARSCAAVVATTNGGATWTGLDGAAYPTAMGGNSSKSPPRLRDLGGNVMGVYPFGCSGITGAHIANATDKAFFVRSVFTGQGWWKSPKYFMTGEPRHCHRVPLGDLVPSPSGRIWAAWAARNRRSYGHSQPSYSTSVYYSDDGGLSWCGWRGPGFNGEVPCSGSRVVCAVPYRGHVAVFGHKDWTRFDGEKWSEPEKTGAGCCYVNALGEEIYLSGPTGPLRWYDGKAWHDVAIPGRTGKWGKLGVCDWKTLLFVEPDESGRKLLCWRKQEGAGWEGPHTIVTEEVPITQVVLQRYGPASFLPAAYMCGTQVRDKMKVHGWPDMNPSPVKSFGHEPSIKVLKVPAEGTGDV